jgi:rubrerythrin
MTQTENNKPETKAPAEPRANLAMTKRGFEPTDLESAYRYAKVMSQSSIMVPMYKNNEANCLILLDTSMRMGVPWMVLMQHMYIVHERPALDATISTALVNRSGEFKDPLEYEVEGKNAKDNDYRVRAYATRTGTGKLLYGPWIDWQLVKGEGWDSKPGSKWKTMPDQMFHYRAASWFQRRYCPELTMGMLTTDEAEDMPRRRVDSVTFDEAQKEATETIAAESGSEIIDACLGTDKPDAETQAKIDKQKADLAAAEKPKQRPGRKPKAEPKDKDKKPKWHCNKCGTNFEEPNSSDVIKGNQCPNCLSWQTQLNEPENKETTDGAPEWPPED